MNATSARLPREPLVEGTHTLHGITEQVCTIVEKPMPRWWWPAFGVASSVATVALLAATYLIATGVGVWGLNQSVGWAYDITNFVFWVGIGHAGTLISAILFLFRQGWRTSINRFAEAMTLFAVACAGVYPTIHVGRVWMLWYFFPVPNSNAIWPQFYSPLLWDFVAISTYGTVSLLFWYVGLIPDFATLRDRATSRVKQIVYGVLAQGWRGSARHWQHYEVAYLYLAALATPLVLSVHTIVSFDFATSVLPGWHATIFPPYFVAGAIFSGFAMVITLMVPLRQLFKLEPLITTQHLDNMAKVVLATGMMVGYAYCTEFFVAMYSGNEAEVFVFKNRAFGPYAWAYWTMFSCNVFAPQIFWFASARRTPWILMTVAITVNVGMWFERFVIIVTSLHRTFLPSTWTYFVPTWVDIAQLVGDFGIFFTLLLLFVRFVPMLAISELKGFIPGSQPHGNDHTMQHHHIEQPPTAPLGARGVVARFADAGALKRAAIGAVANGYRAADAFSPFPIHGLPAALSLPRSPVPLATLVGGIAGALGAYLFQLYIHRYEYPLVVGGKEPGSWEGFAPIIFEAGILVAAFSTVGVVFVLSKLPKLYHPLFAATGFNTVTDDGFFLVIPADHDSFDAGSAATTLARLGGSGITYLEADAR